MKDPTTAAKLSDIDHPYAAKRPPIDTNYFETFNRDNVTLVDVRSAPIERITPDGIRTREGDYPLDIIVFATGFDAMTGPMLRMDIRGRDGKPLAKEWEAGPRNYLGLQIAGFPNLFTVTGPGSPSVLCNMPVAIEQHADWIADCISFMCRNGIERIEAKAEAMDEWVEDGQHRRQCKPCCRWQRIRGTLARTYRGSRACSCLMRVGWRAIGKSAPYIAANNYDGFSLS